LATRTITGEVNSNTSYGIMESSIITQATAGWKSIVQDHGIAPCGRYPERIKTSKFEKKVLRGRKLNRGERDQNNDNWIILVSSQLSRRI